MIIKVIDNGNKYELPYSKDPNLSNIIQFYKTEFLDNNNKFEYTDGISNTQLLEVLLDRIKYLNNILHCDENDQMIIALQSALHWDMKRRLDRDSRGVDGKNIK